MVSFEPDFASIPTDLFRSQFLNIYYEELVAVTCPV